MKNIYLKFHNVDFYYDDAAAHLFKDLTLHIAPGWTGVIGANGAGKTTLLKLAAGRIETCRGYIESPKRVVYCAQRTDAAPEHFDGFVHSLEKSAQSLKGRLKIKEDWAGRWQSLSHGERKRAQIGTALWLEPDLLAVDEPTNHLDNRTRGMLATALQAFGNIGLLVSHDRDLLDSLCRQSLFITPPDVIVRKGGYTKGKRITEEEQAVLKKERAIKKQALKKLKREAGRRRSIADRAEKMRSKKGIAKKDHDAKQKIGAAILTGRDAVGGKLLRQLDGRIDRARKELDGIRLKKDHPLGIRLPGAVSTRDRLLEVSAGTICMGNEKELHYPHLIIQPEDRIGITGDNGSGKSTLIRKLLPFLNVSGDRLVYVPQEIKASRCREILARAKALPNEQKGYLMTIVSRLGSLPERLLKSTIPSPGETRKLLLALGMTLNPHIIIMDEPTNHMDITAIECLEEALLPSPGALVLISHDMQFLTRLTRLRWHIENTDTNRFELQVKGS